MQKMLFLTLSLVLLTGTVSAQEWGSIKGRVVWGESKLPELEVTKVEKGKAPNCPKEIPNEEFVINKDNKGLRYVFVYLRKAPSAVHPDYPQTTDAVKETDTKAFEKMNGFGYDDITNQLANGKIEIKDLKSSALINQDGCRYEPHALAIREGQTLLVLNPEKEAHNVKCDSFNAQNTFNENMPSNSYFTKDALLADRQPCLVQCNIHSWMNMKLMIFDHPYFALTNENGEFEIKNIPAGEIELVMRHQKYIDPSTGGKGNARGAKFAIKAGDTLDLGDIQFKQN